MEYHLALKMEESSHMLKQCMIPIIRGIKIVKFIEAGSRIVVAKDEGQQKNEELLFNGHRLSVKQDRKVLSIYCITICIELTTLYCTL